jgi:GntR family transcriptional regulator
MYDQAMSGPADTQAELLARLSRLSLIRSGGIALHWQCGEALRTLIHELHYPPAVPLPAENELARALGVSRPTLRQAMKQLASEGVVHSQKGVGAFALRSGVTRPLGLSSLYQDLVASGRRPSTKVLVLETVPATPPITGELRITPGTPLLHLARIRYADGVPLIATYSYLALPPGVTLNREQLENDGLYNLMHRVAGIELVGGTQSVSARRATPDECEHLDLEPGSPVMLAHRVAFDAHGRGVEYVHIVYPEGLELQFDLRGTSLRPGVPARGGHPSGGAPSA